MSTQRQRRRGTTAEHATFTGAIGEITIDTTKKTVVVHDGATAGGFPLARHEFVKGTFFKADPFTSLFSKTAGGSASVKANNIFEVNGKLIQTVSATSIIMPALNGGTDYAIYACDDGTFRADSNFSYPSGWTTTNSMKVGGFHYAPGGNATGQSGGNTTAQINEYSFWDMKFRPSCVDPRGMTLVADAFWSDIYLTGVDAITNGSSRYNVTIADGSSPPKIPAMFGGNGSVSYGSYTWFEACQLAAAFGKRLPTQREFMALAYGTTEATQNGSDPGVTSLIAAFISRWGCHQVAGVMWQWGDDRGGAYNTTGWNANTEGFGSEYNAPNAVFFGGDWGHGSNCGSRSSVWSNAASASSSGIGSRFVCDHLILS